MLGFDLVSESNPSLPCVQNYIDMKIIKTTLRFIGTLAISAASAQTPEFIKTTFPTGTVFHQNIPYANDTLKKHLLDF